MAPRDDPRRPVDVDDHRLDEGYPVTIELLALEYGSRQLAFEPTATGDRFVDVLDRLAGGTYDSPQEVRTGIRTERGPDVAIIREKADIFPGEERVDRQPWTSAEYAGSE